MNGGIRMNGNKNGQSETSDFRRKKKNSKDRL